MVGATAEAMAGAATAAGDPLPAAAIITMPAAAAAAIIMGPLLPARAAVIGRQAALPAAGTRI